MLVAASSMKKYQQRIRIIGLIPLGDEPRFRERAAYAPPQNGVAVGRSQDIPRAPRKYPVGLGVSSRSSRIPDREPVVIPALTALRKA